MLLVKREEPRRNGVEKVVAFILFEATKQEVFALLLQRPKLLEEGAHLLRARHFVEELIQFILG